MNIIVKGLLVGPKVKKLEKERRPEETVESYVEAHTLCWRALGAVGKAYNIVKFVRTNPQRRAQRGTDLEDVPTDLGAY